MPTVRGNHECSTRDDPLFPTYTGVCGPAMRWNIPAGSKVGRFVEGLLVRRIVQQTQRL